MTRYWKILIVVGIGALLSGGVFWYAKTNQVQTVFESQKESAITEVAKTESDATPQEMASEVNEEKTATKEEVIQEEKKPEVKEETKDDSQKSVTDEGEKSKSFTIKSALVSFGHESASNRKIDTVVLHSSYSPSGDPYSVSAVRSIWASYGVSPHYMIARDGTVYQLVADKDIAYHAGESTMKDGRKNVNDFSIGVEILNTKDDEYTKAQYQAVKDLIAYLKGKYSIKYVVGHDDIAPGRKTDPWNFDWNKI